MERDNNGSATVWLNFINFGFCIVIVMYSYYKFFIRAKTVFFIGRRDARNELDEVQSHKLSCNLAS